MIIYWMFLGLCPLLAWVAEKKPRRIILSGNKRVCRPSAMWAFLSMFVIILFIGLRSGIADTYAYIGGFKSIQPDSLKDFWSGNSDRGFLLFSYIIKFYVSSDYHLWLFIIAFISGIAVLKGLYDHSVFLPLSVYLYIASTLFTYMLNGMRQFIAISIMFSAFPLLINKKYLKFLLAAILLSTFHLSALIAVPFFFLGLNKPFSFRNFTILIIFVIIAYFSSIVFPYIDQLFIETQYRDISTEISSFAGSNAFRLIVAVIPVALCYPQRRKIEQLASRTLNFIINMSIFHVGFMIVSTTVGGIFIGRMAAYFNIFNLLLYPVIVRILYIGHDRIVLRRSIIIGFIGWFYYQTSISGHLYYISDVLGLTL